MLLRALTITLSLIPTFVSAAQVRVLIQADEEFTVHIGNSEQSSPRYFDDQSAWEQAYEFTENLPAGIHPLTIHVSNYQAAPGLLASVWVDDELVGSTGNDGAWAAKTHIESKFVSISQVCPVEQHWTPAHQNFIEAGGDDSAKYIWPGDCVPSDGRADAYFVFQVEIGSESDYARPVDFHIAAHHEFSRFQVGGVEYSGPQFLTPMHLNSFQLMLEPGVYPVMIFSRAKSSFRGIAASFEIDGDVIGATNGDGSWMATQGIDNEMEPILQTCSFSGRPSNVLDELADLSGSNAQWIWPNGCEDDGTIEAWFLTYITVTSFAAHARPVDFTFAADSGFMLSLNDEVLYRSVEEEFMPNGHRMIGHFTLFLEPGDYPLTFNSIDSAGDFRGFIGTVKSGDDQLAVTGGEKGWNATNSDDGEFHDIAESCSDIAPRMTGVAEAIQTIANVSSAPEWIWPNGCKSDGMQHAHFRFMLTIPESASDPFHLPAHPCTSCDVCHEDDVYPMTSIEIEIHILAELLSNLHGIFTLPENAYVMAIALIRSAQDGDRNAWAIIDALTRVETACNKCDSGKVAMMVAKALSKLIVRAEFTLNAELWDSVVCKCNLVPLGRLSGASAHAFASAEAKDRIILLAGRDGADASASASASATAHAFAKEPKMPFGFNITNLTSTIQPPATVTVTILVEATANAHASASANASAIASAIASANGTSPDIDGMIGDEPFAEASASASASASAHASASASAMADMDLTPFVMGNDTVEGPETVIFGEPEYIGSNVMMGDWYTVTDDGLDGEVQTGMEDDYIFVLADDGTPLVCTIDEILEE